MMKNMPYDFSFDEVPELDGAEFALSVSPCSRLEDSNDIGDIGDSFSIRLTEADSLFDESDW
jgi:hypothetical protein